MRRSEPHHLPCSGLKTGTMRGVVVGRRALSAIQQAPPVISNKTSGVGNPIDALDRSSRFSQRRAADKHTASREARPAILLLMDIVYGCEKNATGSSFVKFLRV
jgi:hypothetical protein